MLLQDFFDQLTYGELAQVSIGNVEQEGVVPENYPHVATQINLGLLALAKRFTLNTGTVKVQEYDTINTYQLHSDFSVNSASAEPIKYIEDTVAEPFSDDVLKIEKIEDISDSEDITEIPYNILNNTDSILRRSYNKFYVPDSSGTRLLSITYRAAVKPLVIDTLDPDVDIIDIPPTLNQALLYYVAAKLHANRPTIDGQESTEAKYLNLYEKECVEIDTENLIEEDDFVNSKLDDNGWH